MIELGFGDHLLGTIIIHALDEKARAYYNLEKRWTGETLSKEHTQVKICGLRVGETFIFRNLIQSTVGA